MKDLKTSQRIQCSKRIWVGYHKNLCSKNATVLHNGKDYCTQHAPERVAEKDRLRREKWDKELAESRRRDADRERADAVAELVPDILAWCESQEMNAAWVDTLRTRWEKGGKP